MYLLHIEVFERRFKRQEKKEEKKSLKGVPIKATIDNLGATIHLPELCTLRKLGWSLGSKEEQECPVPEKNPPLVNVVLGLKNSPEAFQLTGF